MKISGSYKIILLTAAIILIIIVSFLVYTTKILAPSIPKITNFEECKLAGNKILEKYPAVCVLRDGTSFTESINLEKNIMCTMDAMMCPNGTYVGRSGPNCEFVCP